MKEAHKIDRKENYEADEKYDESKDQLHFLRTCDKIRNIESYI